MGLIASIGFKKCVSEYLPGFFIPTDGVFFYEENRIFIHDLQEYEQTQSRAKLVIDGNFYWVPERKEVKSSC